MIEVGIRQFERSLRGKSVVVGVRKSKISNGSEDRGAGTEE